MCNLVQAERRFEGKYCLHFRVKEQAMQVLKKVDQLDGICGVFFSFLKKLMPFHLSFI
jgi:hypothetical protein